MTGIDVIDFYPGILDKSLFMASFYQIFRHSFVLVDPSHASIFSRPRRVENDGTRSVKTTYFRLVS